MPRRRQQKIPIDPELLRADRERFAHRQTVHTSSVAPSFHLAVSSARRTPSPPTLGHHSAPSEADIVLDRLEYLEDIIKEQDEKIIDLERTVDQQREKLYQLEEKFIRFGALLDEAGWEADGEDHSTDLRSRRKRKRTSAPKRILTDRELEELTEDQKKVRKDLQDYLCDKLRVLAGTSVNSNTLPADLEPGEHTLPDGSTVLIPDFGKEITCKANERLISQAAHLIYREQMDPETRHLRAEGVVFTERDVLVLAKDQFHAWKRMYGIETDAEKAKKHEEAIKKGKRYQHRREKKRERTKVAGEYLLTHGADPLPLLYTDWMSDYVSECDSLDEIEKAAYRGKVLYKAGYAVNGDNDDTVVWERVRPGFRSDQINKVYDDLDTILKEKKLEAKTKRHAYRHACLKRVNNARLPHIAPYPFMVCEAWKREFVNGKDLDEPFAMKREDPEGFGSKKRNVEEDSSDDDQTSSV